MLPWHSKEPLEMVHPFGILFRPRLIATPMVLPFSARTSPGIGMHPRLAKGAHSESSGLLTYAYLAASRLACLALLSLHLQAN